MYKRNEVGYAWRRGVVESIGSHHGRIHFEKVCAIDRDQGWTCRATVVSAMVFIYNREL